MARLQYYYTVIYLLSKHQLLSFTPISVTAIIIAHDCKYLNIATEIVVLCLCLSIAIHPGYGSISLKHGRRRVATTETKAKILSCTDGREMSVKPRKCDR